MTHPPVALAIMGPTASGKSALALRLARELGGEIISVDSSLVYRGMDIGTAKPSAEERADVPHHLIDILDPREHFSTGQFRAQALQLIESISARGRLPVLVGGTMLYFNALFHGLADLPKADPLLRASIEEEARRHGWTHLHRELERVDPQSARRIHPNDPQRIQRAIEVYRLTGRALTELWAEAGASELAFRPVKLIVSPENRELLHARIRQRFLEMLERGFLGEVETLFGRGDLDESLPSIRSVGYRQVWAYLKGECDYEQMTEAAIAATRQLAKRQFTWLRREREGLWFESELPVRSEQLIVRVSAALDREVSYAIERS